NTHAARPTHIINSDAAASATVECMTSGAITPATTPFAAEAMKACSDDAMPRRCGYRSSTSRVTTGTIRAQPRENTTVGAMAQDAFALNSRLATRLST